MPLTGSESVLAAALRAQMIARPTGAKIGDVVQNDPALTALCEAIAAAVIAHITANAVVNPLGLIAPPGAAGGPVTGTGTIT